MPLNTVNIDELYKEKLSAFIKDANFTTLKNALIARAPLSEVFESLEMFLEEEYQDDREDLAKNLTQKAIASQVEKDEHASQNHEALITQFKNKLAQLEVEVLAVEAGKPKVQEQITILSEQIKKAETNLTTKQYILDDLQRRTQLRYPMILDQEQQETLIITNSAKLAQINQVNEQGQECTTLQKNLEEMKKQLIALQENLANVSELKSRLGKLEQEAQDRKMRGQEHSNGNKNIEVLLSQENIELLNRAIDQDTAELKQIKDKLNEKLAHYRDTSYELFIEELEQLLAQRLDNINSEISLKVNENQAQWLCKRIHEIKLYPVKVKELQEQAGLLYSEIKTLNEEIVKLSDQRKGLTIENSNMDPQHLRNRRNKTLGGSVFWASGAVTSFLIVFTFMASPINFIIPGIFAFATALYWTMALIDHISQITQTKKIAQNNTKIDTIDIECENRLKQMKTLQLENIKLDDEIKKMTSSLSHDDSEIEQIKTQSLPETKSTVGIRYRFNYQNSHPSALPEQPVKTEVVDQGHVDQENTSNFKLN